MKCANLGIQTQMNEHSDTKIVLKLLYLCKKKKVSCIW